MHKAFTSVSLMLHSAHSYPFEIHCLERFIVSCRSDFLLIEWMCLLIDKRHMEWPRYGCMRSVK